MAQPTPVLLVVHSLEHGGMERQVSVLARHLDPSRFEVHAASVLGGFRADELKAEGKPVLTIPIRSFFNPGPWALSGFLADYIRKHGIRLVHNFDPGLSMVTLLAARRVRGVKMLSSQRFFMDLVPPRYRYPLCAVHWLADGIVANSNALKGHLHHDYYLPLRKIEVCHNAVDTSEFSPAGRKRIPQLEGAPLVMGTVCVMRPEKQLPWMVEAFARVHKQTPQARLLLMGSGPEEEPLRALAAQLGLSDACCFLPSGPDVRPAMRSTDIFLMTSVSEGLPNAVMEAMACGCAIVSANVGGCPELIRHGEHGLLSKPSDWNDFAQCLETLAGQPELCARMGRAASARIAEEFSIAASVGKMESIYDKYR